MTGHHPTTLPGPAIRNTIFTSALCCAQAFAGPVGMVSDNGSDRVSIFNADLDVITASLDARPGMALGDCVVSADEHTGITTSSGGEITFVNLGSQAPETPENTRISNLGVDMAISPDDHFVVMAGGGAVQQPLSVVNTRSREEVATSNHFADHTSVEFCDSGTLLITTTHGRYLDWNPDNGLYDARLAEDGEIILLGSRISSGAQPNNASCAPGSLSGVLLDREGAVTSFTLPDMEVVQQHQLPSSMAIASVFSADGKRLFVRTTNGVETFDFNPVTGEMAASWSQPVADTATYFGIDQIAIHPEGGKLYVDGGRSMLILDTATGEQKGEFPLSDTTGICFANHRGPPMELPLVMD